MLRGLVHIREHTTFCVVLVGPPHQKHKKKFINTAHSKRYINRVYICYTYMFSRCTSLARAHTLKSMRADVVGGGSMHTPTTQLYDAMAHHHREHITLYRYAPSKICIRPAVGFVGTIGRPINESHTSAPSVCVAVCAQ